MILDTNINFDPMKIGFNYILEDKHIGNQEYIKTKVRLYERKKWPTII